MNKPPAFPASRFRLLRSLLSRFLALCGFASAASAANFTWTGSGNWNVATNWSSGTAFTSNNTPVFSGSAISLFSNNNLSNAQIVGITFNPDAEAYTLTGNTGTLTGNIVNNSANLQTINLGLRLNNTRTITTNGNGGDITINGVISQDASDRGLTKLGRGTLTLTAANTYAGTTLVEVGGGTLKLDFSASGAPISNILGGGSLSLGSTLQIVGKDGENNVQSFSQAGNRANGAGNFVVTSGSGGTVTVNTGNFSPGSSGGYLNLIPDAGTTFTATNNVLAQGVYTTRGLFNSSDWVTNTGTLSPESTYTLTAYTDYYTGNINSVTANDNMLLTASPATLAATGTMYTLKIAPTASGETMNLGAGTRELLLAGGSILFTGSNDFTITNGILRGATAGSEFRIYQMGTPESNLTIATRLGGTQGTWSFSKHGPGTVTLTNSSNTYTGGTTITGGILSISLNAQLNAVSSGTYAALTLSGGTLQATNTLNLDNGAGVSRNVVITAVGGGIDVTDANTLTVSGTISGAGDLIKTNTGTLAVTGTANTYSGSVYVNAGSLLVNNVSGTAGLGTGNVIVNDGGKLGGTGAFTGAVTVNSGGTLLPGASIESLGFGSLTMNDGSTFGYEVDSSVALSLGADLQKVSGDLNLTGTVTLTLNNIAISPTAFGLGTTFSLINYTGAWNGGLFTFGGVAIGNGGSFTDAFSNTWQLDYNATIGGSNFSTEYLGGNFVNITAVPEPNTLWMLAAGAVVLTFLRRSHRAQRQ